MALWKANKMQLLSSFDSESWVHLRIHVFITLQNTEIWGFGLLF